MNTMFKTIDTVFLEGKDNEWSIQGSGLGYIIFTS